ncbi:hypothetical protein GCM10007989_07810 [Devosia pacifica]|uniref:DNA (cytosine-5-)-methyltransferase n=2 Tax=Devosia pacifica TaxID=1335967 RepID=A0A918VNL4_9HYPH|nr:hypothetical protein GCM10007989_07810 [Devosia pacifica]
MEDCAIFLCDRTGVAAEPWAEAGIECFCVDVQHSIRRPRREGSINFVWGDVRSWTPPQGYRPVFVGAWPPCTHVSGSGARDHATKRGLMLRDALEIFEACRQAIAWSGAPGFLENPVGYFSTVPHIGKPAHYFHPSDYTGWCADDHYTKKTCIWPMNGFVMPEKFTAPHLADVPPDDRIHKASPTSDRGDIRSASPRGFCRAVFNANAPARYREKKAA